MDGGTGFVYTSFHAPQDFFDLGRPWLCLRFTDLYRGRQTAGAVDPEPIARRALLHLSNSREGGGGSFRGKGAHSFGLHGQIRKRSRAVAGAFDLEILQTGGLRPGGGALQAERRQVLAGAR